MQLGSDHSDQSLSRKWRRLRNRGKAHGLRRSAVRLRLNPEAFHSAWTKNDQDLSRSMIPSLSTDEAVAVVNFTNVQGDSIFQQMFDVSDQCFGFGITWHLRAEVFRLPHARRCGSGTLTVAKAGMISHETPGETVKLHELWWVVWKSYQNFLKHHEVKSAQDLNSPKLNEFLKPQWKQEEQTRVFIRTFPNQNERVDMTEAMTPIERAMQPWLDGPRPDGSCRRCLQAMWFAGVSCVTLTSSTLVVVWSTLVGGSMVWLEDSREAVNTELADGYGEVVCISDLGVSCFWTRRGILLHLAVFHIQTEGGREGTIVGVDQDGDLPVILKSGCTGATRPPPAVPRCHSVAIWVAVLWPNMGILVQCRLQRKVWGLFHMFITSIRCLTFCPAETFLAKLCRKAMSIGDRVRYNSGAVGEIINFDNDGAALMCDLLFAYHVGHRVCMGLSDVWISKWWDFKASMLLSIWAARSISVLHFFRQFLCFPSDTHIPVRWPLGETARRRHTEMVPLLLGICSAWCKQRIVRKVLLINGNHGEMKDIDIMDLWF